MLYRIIGEIKVFSDWFGCVLVVSFYVAEVFTELVTVKSVKANVSSVSPSSERLEELWIVCGFICKKLGYAINGNMVTRKQE